MFALMSAVGGKADMDLAQGMSRADISPLPGDRLRSVRCSLLRGHKKRRDFGGFSITAAVPFASNAQQAGKPPTISFSVRYIVFVARLWELGWLRSGIV